MLLEKAMASVVRQDFPKSDYEIVVVDNGSTDGAADIARGFQHQAEVRYVREERIGLCIARNTGWQAAAGRYIAFFDDDAIARPGWLQEIRDAFVHAPGSIGVVGGRVDPIWKGPRPAWLADEIAGSLTIVDWGPMEKIIQDIRREWLVGANMAMPRTLLAEVGGFHPWLDRVGDNLLSSGDVFLQREIMRRGYHCLYVPAIAIEHLVPPSRLTKDWFMKRFYWQGVSDAVMHLIENAPAPAERLRLAFARAMAVMRSPKRLRSLMASGSESESFKAKCLALVDIGFIAGLLGAAKR
jgi:glycosyltransferase involved in cell wall biosynthesis